MQAAAHVGDRAERHDVQAIVREHTDIEAAHGLVVLEDDRVGRQAGANLVDGERRAALQDRELFVRALDLVERLDELFLDRPRAAAQALHATWRRPLGLEFFLFELARVPGQLLPQPAHLVARRAGGTRRQVDRAKGDEIRQAA